MSVGEITIIAAVRTTEGTKDAAAKATECAPHITDAIGLEVAQPKLELGYPSSSFYRGKDPRNNDELMKSLDQAGKLINNRNP